MPTTDLSKLLSQLAEAQQTANPAQRSANKTNSQKSTGPRTPEGKARAKMNALRHGLTGQFCVMSEADHCAYTTFEAGILEARAPAGHYERDLAVSIAQNRWRLHRARAVESNIHGLGHHNLAGNYDTNSPDTEVAVAQAQTWLTHLVAITNLTLYEIRIRRDVARDKKELDELQTVRKAAESKAREEAELILQQSITKKEPLTDTATATIEVNGFVFSTTTLRASLNQKAALKSARFYQANNGDRTKTSPPPPKNPRQEHTSHPKVA
jgi:hypothetical protein